MSTIRVSKKIWKVYLIGLVWFFGLLWPLLGIHSDGSIDFRKSVAVWLYVAGGTFVCMLFYELHANGVFKKIGVPLASARRKASETASAVPKPVWFGLVLLCSLVFPLFTNRYAQDVAINVLVYICLGLGLNVVVGLAGMLDLGYIAFYGVGAYTYALLSVNFQLSFWLSLPISAFFACIAGCIIGYPTLRMRGDYLAIVTLGFGEIVRIVLNNWMELTNGPNGILGIQAPGIYYPTFADGFGFEHLWLKKLHFLYYLILALAVFTIIAVHRLTGLRRSHGADDDLHAERADSREAGGTTIRGTGRIACR